MKVPYGEGIASHIGSESCGCIRKDTVEALTGVRAGWVLSPEIDAFGVPTRFRLSEGHAGLLVIARVNRTPRDRRPHARTQAPHKGGFASRSEAGRPHAGPRTGTVRDANPKGVRRR